MDLNKTDDLKKFVVRRSIMDAEDDEKVKKTKAPKIQRLVTPITLQRKRSIKNSMIKKVKQSREDKIAYQKVLHDYRVAQKEKRQSEIARKKASKKKKVSKTE